MQSTSPHSPDTALRSEAGDGPAAVPLPVDSTTMDDTTETHVAMEGNTGLEGSPPLADDDAIVHAISHAIAKFPEPAAPATWTFDVPHIPRQQPHIIELMYECRVLRRMQGVSLRVRQCLVQLALLTHRFSLRT